MKNIPDETNFNDMLTAKIQLKYSCYLSSFCSHLLSSEYVERHLNQDGRPSQSVVRMFAWSGDDRFQSVNLSFST